MPFPAMVYRVLIASPSDVPNERRVIANAMHDWNSQHAMAEGVFLLPVMWETDVRPETGGRPQGFINQQIVKDSDILIGVFWTKIGTPTGKEDSGTVEEIKEFVGQQKPTMLYFSDRAVRPNRYDPEQFQRLETFKNWCRAISVFSTFSSTPHLTHAITNHLTRTVRALPNANALTPQDNQTLRFEEMALSNARAEHIRRLGGDSPPTAEWYRERMTRKACLSLAGLDGYTTRPEAIESSFTLRNEGQYPAYDIRVSTDVDGSPVVSESTLGELQEGKTHLFAFRIPRPPQTDPPQEPCYTFTVRAKFRDGLGNDEATFVFTMTGRDPYYKFEEDVTEAEVSAFCRYVRPR